MVVPIRVAEGETSEAGTVVHVTLGLDFYPMEFGSSSVVPKGPSPKMRMTVPPESFAKGVEHVETMIKANVRTELRKAITLRALEQSGRITIQLREDAPEVASDTAPAEKLPGDVSVAKTPLRESKVDVAVSAKELFDESPFWAWSMLAEGLAWAGREVVGNIENFIRLHKQPSAQPVGVGSMPWPPVPPTKFPYGPGREARAAWYSKGNEHTRRFVAEQQERIERLQELGNLAKQKESARLLKIATRLSKLSGVPLPEDGPLETLVDWVVETQATLLKQSAESLVDENRLMRIATALGAMTAEHPPHDKGADQLAEWIIAKQQWTIERLQNDCTSSSQRLQRVAEEIERASGESFGLPVRTEPLLEDYSIQWAQRMRKRIDLLDLALKGARGEGLKPNEMLSAGDRVRGLHADAQAMVASELFDGAERDEIAQNVVQFIADALDKGDNVYHDELDASELERMVIREVGYKHTCSRAHAWLDMFAPANPGPSTFEQMRHPGKGLEDRIKRLGAAWEALEKANGSLLPLRDLFDTVEFSWDGSGTPLAFSAIRLLDDGRIVGIIHGDAPSVEARIDSLVFAEGGRVPVRKRWVNKNISPSLRFVIVSYQIDTVRTDAEGRRTCVIVTMELTTHDNKKPTGDESDVAVSDAPAVVAEPKVIPFVSVAIEDRWDSLSGVGTIDLLGHGPLVPYDAPEWGFVGRIEGSPEHVEKTAANLKKLSEWQAEVRVRVAGQPLAKGEPVNLLRVMNSEPTILPRVLLCGVNISPIQPFDSGVFANVYMTMVKVEDVPAELAAAKDPAKDASDKVWVHFEDAASQKLLSTNGILGKLVETAADGRRTFEFTGTIEDEPARVDSVCTGLFFAETTDALLFVHLAPFLGQEVAKVLVRIDRVLVEEQKIQHQHDEFNKTTEKRASIELRMTEVLESEVAKPESSEPQPPPNPAQHHDHVSNFLDPLRFTHSESNRSVSMRGVITEGSLLVGVMYCDGQAIDDDIMDFRKFAMERYPLRLEFLGENSDLNPCVQFRVHDLQFHRLRSDLNGHVTRALAIAKLEAVAAIDLALGSSRIAAGLVTQSEMDEAEAKRAASEPREADAPPPRTIQIRSRDAETPVEFAGELEEETIRGNIRAGHNRIYELNNQLQTLCMNEVTVWITDSKRPNDRIQATLRSVSFSADRFDMSGDTTQASWLITIRYEEAPLLKTPTLIIESFATSDTIVVSQATIASDLTLSGTIVGDPPRVQDAWLKLQELSRMGARLHLFDCRSDVAEMFHNGQGCYKAVSVEGTPTQWRREFPDKDRDATCVLVQKVQLERIDEEGKPPTRPSDSGTNADSKRPDQSATSKADARVHRFECMACFAKYSIDHDKFEHGPVRFQCRSCGSKLYVTPEVAMVLALPIPLPRPSTSNSMKHLDDLPPYQPPAREADNGKPFSPEDLVRAAEQLTPEGINVFRRILGLAVGGTDAFYKRPGGAHDPATEASAKISGTTDALARIDSNQSDCNPDANNT